MAAYRWVDDLVTCRLTACTLGSAPGPTLGNEYGKPLLTACVRNPVVTQGRTKPMVVEDQFFEFFFVL